MDCHLDKDLEKKVELMMRKSHLVDKKFHDKKKYVPALLDACFKQMR